MKPMDQAGEGNQPYTDKTREELLEANWEDLTADERSLQSLLKNGSEDLTLEEAKEFLNSLP